MTQIVVAGVLVVLAALYAAWLLAPARWQLLWLRWIEQRLGALHAPQWLHGFVSRHVAARQTAAGGCSSCSASSPTPRKP